MEFLDDVIEAAQKTGQFIYDKTGNAVSYISLEYKCATIKNKIGDLYKLLGKIVYKESISQNNYDDKKQEIISQIKDLTEQYKEVSLQMKKFKCICENCGASNSAKSEFCSKCGNPLK